MMIQDLEAHFRGLAPKNHGLLAELEAEARREGIPIVGPLVGRLLTLLARWGRAARVLELGTAIGYSAIHLADGLEPGGSLICVEWDPDMAVRARDNLRRAGHGACAQVLEGAAAEVLPGLDGPLDLVFLDVDKGGYAPLLPQIWQHLRPGGLLVTDNTGFGNAEEFNRALRENSAWLEVNLLGFLPEHSPERDGLALALRAG